jgi:tripartite-type tricarboxylate transporter receptor subunit TctC
VHRHRALILALMIGAFCPGAWAQSFPAKPVKLVVPFAAGGAADLFARTLASGMSNELGQQVFIEVHAGVGGLTGVNTTAKSAPDGYTICFAGAAALSAFPFMLSRMPFDWQKDLALLTLAVRVPEAVIVRPALGVGTLREFVAYARANPGKVNFGSAGAGSITHLGAELLKSEARIDIAHVPYRGIGPAIADMLGDHIDMLVGDVPFLVPHIQSGAVKALAITSGARAGALPEVPTTGEAGYPAVNSDNWYGLVAPAGTPASVLARLRVAAVATLQGAELKEKFAEQSALASPMTPEEFAMFIRAEQAKWQPVVAAAGVRLD